MNSVPNARHGTEVSKVFQAAQRPIRNDNVKHSSLIS
jgi:hypothetical protein